MKGIITLGALALSGMMAFLPVSGTETSAEELNKADQCFIEFVPRGLRNRGFGL